MPLRKFRLEVVSPSNEEAPDEGILHPNGGISGAQAC